MPFPKRFVDGVLLNWGDRLFYEPLRRRRAPRMGAGKLSAGTQDAARLRAELARTVRRAPEVMVKITNKASGSNGINAIRRHLDYISRNGKVELEDQDGQSISGAGALGDLVEEWRRGGWGIPAESRRRETFNVLLSMPPGTDRQAVRDAAREFARIEFGDNHAYVFAAHNDEAHPHVHLSVQARGRDGRRLNPRKADLQGWRETFAAQLREHGVEANATPRRTRGVTQRYPKQAVVHMRARGVVPDYDRDAAGRDDAYRSATLNAHIGALAAWREMGQALAGSSSAQDRRLAIDVADFVRRMAIVREASVPRPEAVRGRPPERSHASYDPGAGRADASRPVEPGPGRVDPDPER
ncbi:relaxase/mobilization nuclease domain-containing protein [Paraburkholderia sp. BCC1885]|uniref:relaxase/mobilization nuclease domain-containing protein n=1 Tax=Paraburkholderia sp. BCC1885 TaxID=2562669 RepID=UPI001182E7DA|nr:relaxase/mobilization nuclease domain-containing protein [Paraburkholderia sp. BCC1885]